MGADASVADVERAGIAVAAVDRVFEQDRGPRSTRLAAPVTHVGLPVSVPWLFVPAVSAVVPPVPSLKAKAPRRPVPVPICWSRLAWISDGVRAWSQMRTSSI
jgi:hypothetical protein